jgi:hypothetical protein
MMFAVVAWASISVSIASPAAHPVNGGYVVGNFGISSRIAESGGLSADIRVNPPELGQFLEDFAHGELWFEGVEPSVHRLALRPVETSRLYPEYRGTFDVDSGVSVEIRIFAPLGLSAKTGFLPALIVQTTLRAQRPWHGMMGYTLVPKNAIRANTAHLESAELSGLVRGSAFLGLAGSSARDTSLRESATRLTVATTLHMDKGSEQQRTFIVGYFHPNGYYANEFPSAQRLLAALAEQTTSYAAQLAEFEAALPVTGDRTIDGYLRWYSSAAIFLTKGLRTGEVLTMGYRELNQRDSYWAAALHLVFWKDLERKMIVESIQGQLPSGRIPVTLLPTIDRGDEIDSAEYFILRVARFCHWYRDDPLLAQAWPAVKKAIAYLQSRDLEKVDMPMQTSYWADWKDVPGVEGRKYAPHFELLWLAALEAASELAVAAHDTEAAADYRNLEGRAREAINRPVEQGGLWNGSNYVDRWQDGHLPKYVLEDQVMGAYFDVIPADRLRSIYRQLKGNETAYGVRETFPYAPYSSGFYTTTIDGGNYHNGGIWPYLNFVDAASRYTHGEAADAERIIHEVGRADLEASNDYQPHEFLNGDDGRNLGASIISWDSALFATIYFGAFGLERTSPSNFEIHVHIPPPRDFSTQLLLPGCTGTLSRRGDRLMWEDGDSCRRLGMTVTIK